MDEENLAIQEPVRFDESIAHVEVHTHQPYTASKYNNNDEIRIAIQNQDLCVLPSKSSLHITGKITKPDGTPVTLANTKLINNAIGFLFDEIRYELNAIEIDKCKNVGMTMQMKGYASFSDNDQKWLENAGWLPSDERAVRITNDEGIFDVSIPLSIILGFAEDYHKIIVGAKHELILVRSRTDVNAVVQVETTAATQTTPAVYEDFKIEITRLEWLMPYVVLSDKRKIELYNRIKGNAPIAMSFRSWELYENPQLSAGTKQIWTVKTSNQLEKPRFIILALQTNRRDLKAANASKFDHCHISDIKLYLNSQYYPYANLNLNINKNEYALAYDMYTNFRNAYYQFKGQNADPWINKRDFINSYPLFIIDCSKQNESLKQAAVDVRLEIETRSNIPAGTRAYCLILHDRIINYKPISGDVTKLM